MEIVKENMLEPQILFNLFEKCRLPFSVIPQQEVLQFKEGESDSDSGTITEVVSSTKIDIKNLPQLKVRLERMRFPMKKKTTTSTILEQGTDLNLSFDKKLLSGSESDDSLETIVVNQINPSDEILLAVNHDMERMEVESDTDSVENLILSGDNVNVINSESENEESVDSFIIHDASNISVCLERISSPQEYQHDEKQETDEIEDKLEDEASWDSLIPTCYVALKRMNIKTVTLKSDDNDMSSPEGSSMTLYGHHLPKAKVRLERIPDSVFRKYGISIPEQSTLSSQYSYKPREDKNLYCVLGIKLLLQKRKQEGLFNQRMSEIRDFIIPARNNLKMKISTKKRWRLQKLRLSNLPSKTLNYEDDGNTNN